jgi:hypothetical protein
MHVHTFISFYESHSFLFLQIFFIRFDFFIEINQQQIKSLTLNKKNSFITIETSERVHCWKTTQSDWERKREKMKFPQHQQRKQWNIVRELQHCDWMREKKAGEKKEGKFFYDDDIV